MKKILIVCSAFLLILGTISCNKKNTATSDLNDSLTISLGRFAGDFCANAQKRIIQNLSESQQKKFSKEEILRGIQFILSIDTANIGYLYGLQAGFSLTNEINTATSYGADINRNKLMKYIKQALNSDSDSISNPQFEYSIWQNFLGKLRTEYNNKMDDEKMQTPEALKNGEEGDAFIKKEKEKDPEIKTTSSGLSYKIVNPGEGDDVITEKDRLDITFKGKLIDGTIFDSVSDKEGTRSVFVSKECPGLKEGLMLLKKGGKATFYIPGNLGYRGFGRETNKVSIGPNETLVYDVEVIDIKTASNSQPRTTTTTPTAKVNTSTAK